MGRSKWWHIYSLKLCIFAVDIPENRLCALLSERMLPDACWSENLSVILESKLWNRILHSDGREKSTWPLPLLAARKRVEGLAWGLCLDLHLALISSSWRWVCLEHSVCGARRPECCWETRYFFKSACNHICMRFSLLMSVSKLAVSTESVVVLPLWQAWVVWCSCKSPVVAKEWLLQWSSSGRYHGSCEGVCWVAGRSSQRWMVDGKGWEVLTSYATSSSDY